MLLKVEMHSPLATSVPAVLGQCRRASASPPFKNALLRQVRAVTPAITVRTVTTRAITTVPLVLTAALAVLLQSTPAFSEEPAGPARTFLPEVKVEVREIKAFGRFDGQERAKSGKEAAAGAFEGASSWADRWAGSSGDPGPPPGVARFQPNSLAPGQRAKAKNPVDAALSDIRVQLEQLDFSEFRFLGSHAEVIPLKRKALIRLDQGHFLTVRPLYIEPRRVGLWLKWVDQRGMELLDTRLHLTPEESMITGTDAADNCGTLLAIRVHLQSRD